MLLGLMYVYELWPIIWQLQSQSNTGQNYKFLYHTQGVRDKYTHYIFCTVQENTKNEEL